MICSRCGEVLPDNSTICPKCGADIKEAAPDIVPTPTESEARACEKCGAALEEEHTFSSSCGVPADNKNICSKCGASLEEGQAFCPSCGQKAGTSDNRTSEIGSKIKKKPVIIGVIAAAVVLVIIVAVVILNNNPGPAFQKIYDEYCDPIWASVGSDGSYLSIDTNPFNEDDNGLAYPDAYTAVEEVNDALGLPTSLLEDMGNTTGANGKQTETFDDVVVTWRYHPDKGLEVTYKKNK